MTDALHLATGSEDTDSAAAEDPESKGSGDEDNIQSLTDFFDQMDRAAFKRVLDNRDSLRSGVVPPRVQRR
jgi:hypothetical protein